MLSYPLQSELKSVQGFRSYSSLNKTNIFVTQIRAREIAFLKCQLEAAGVMVCPSRATHGVSITPVTRQPRPSVWDASILWPNGLDDRVEFLTHLTHGNSNDVLGGCQNPFRGRASSCPSVFRGLPKLANNMFRIDVQYLGNAA